MPPRGVYKARQETRTRQADRSARPARESRSDQRQRDRQDAERRQQEAQARRAREADAKRKKAQADAIIAQRKERERKARANQARNTMTRSKPVVVKSGMTGNQLGRQIQDPSDIQATIKAGKKFQTQQKQNNAVKSSTVTKMSPPLSKPKSPTKFTISGGLIKGGTIYKDPITGSTLAGKETRIKAITDPKSVKVVGSRNRQTLLQATPDMSQTQLFNTQQKITSNNVDVVNRLENPQQTKLDLVTGEKITPTLLTELSRKRKRKQKSGFTGIMSQIRSLLG